MSIHVNLNAEARDSLNQQLRRTKLLSLLVSLGAVATITLALSWFMLPSLMKEIPVIVTYSPQTMDEKVEVTKKVSTKPARKPAAPSSSLARVIASNAAMPVSVPIPEISSELPSLDFGSGYDFGTGWDDRGTAAGGGSMFGSTAAITGALKGRLYDLKQSRAGSEISYDPSTRSYAGIAERAERRRFSPSAFTKYFEAPTELSLTHLAIPFSPASLGPEYFGAKEAIKPSGWIATYHGRLVAPESGRYRFRAASDDYLLALVNGRRNLVACWPDLQPMVAGNFRTGRQEGSTQSPLGSAQLHAGKWIELRAGQIFEFTLAIGERPGGMVGFLLEVEKEGETYRTAPDGRKILPLFTTHPFTDAERQEIEGRFGSYEFEWNNVPVFGIR